MRERSGARIAEVTPRTVEGREIELELDAMTGHAVAVGGGPGLLIGPQGTLVRPSVSTTEVPVDRSKLSDPALMRGVIVNNE